MAATPKPIRKAVKKIYSERMKEASLYPTSKILEKKAKNNPFDRNLTKKVVESKIKNKKERQAMSEYYNKKDNKKSMAK